MSHFLSPLSSCHVCFVFRVFNRHPSSSKFFSSRDEGITTGIKSHAQFLFHSNFSNIIICSGPNADGAFEPLTLIFPIFEEFFWIVVLSFQ